MSFRRGSVLLASLLCCPGHVGAAMMHVAKDSTCGRPGKVVCCRGTAKNGKTKKGVIAKSADVCVRKKKVRRAWPCPPRHLASPLTASSTATKRAAGSFHNFPMIQGSMLRYCLSNCNGTTDTLCDGLGESCTALELDPVRSQPWSVAELLRVRRFRHSCSGWRYAISNVMPFAGQLAPREPVCGLEPPMPPSRRYSRRWPE